MRAKAWPLAALLLLTLIVAGCTSPQPAADGGNSGGDSMSPTSSNQTANNASRGAGNATKPIGNATANATAPMVELSVGSAGQYPLNPAFDPATLSVAAGSRVHVTFKNNDQLPLFNHDWTLEGVDGAKTDAIASGATAEAMFAAPAPGDYKYYCSVSDHREKGMEGTLTVTAA